MNSERKAFLEWVKREYPIMNQWCLEDIEEYKTIVDYMFVSWQASAQRQGYKLVPVEPNTGIDYEYMEQNYKAK